MDKNSIQQCVCCIAPFGMPSKENNYIRKVGELHREDVYQRFSTFLPGIGLLNG
jgi:hypothetical protein